MTHRERFYKVVNYEKADRAVFDLSGSPQTAIDYPKTERGIAALLGIKGEKQGKNVDDRILTAFNIDTRRVGGIDTQHLLTEGTKEEIKAGVKRILSILDVNGGYIFAPAHCIQQDVPPENVIAMYEGAKEYYK